MTIEEMCIMTERQLFDRKSARVSATALATSMIAFANADGGLLAVGIEDDGRITGIDAYTNNVNEIYRVPFDFCKPSIMIETEIVDCIFKSYFLSFDDGARSEIMNKPDMEDAEKSIQRTG